jgi:hypothetical protein
LSDGITQLNACGVRVRVRVRDRVRVRVRFRSPNTKVVGRWSVPIPSFSHESTLFDAAWGKRERERDTPRHRETYWK